MADDDWFDEDTLREMVPELEADVAALRGALQALVDAIDAPWWTWADTNAARAVAVAVLTGQETDGKPS